MLDVTSPWIARRANRLLALSLALVAGPPVHAAAPAPAYHPAGPDVTGISQPEDVLTIPGTNWVIAGSMKTQTAPGHLYMFDGAAHAPALRQLYPSSAERQLDKGRFPECPGPLDDTKFTPHGIGLTHRAGGEDELLVVNHGGRESIEFFRVAMKGGEPEARWIGCVVLPGTAGGNSVIGLPDGGVAVSEFLNKADPNFLDKMAHGAPTGGLYVWRPGKGWSTPLGQQFSGTNGVAVSRDGRWLFVNEWSGYKVWRFPLSGGGAPRSVRLDFMPDNLRLEDDGSILVAGQAGDPVGVMTCKKTNAPCPPGFTVVSMDAGTMRTKLLARGGDARFGGATGATYAGGALWIGSYYGETIARYAPN